MNLQKVNTGSVTLPKGLTQKNEVPFSLNHHKCSPEKVGQTRLKILFKFHSIQVFAIAFYTLLAVGNVHTHRPINGFSKEKRLSGVSGQAGQAGQAVPTRHYLVGGVHV